MNIGMSRVAGGLLVGMQKNEGLDAAAGAARGTTMSICNASSFPTGFTGTYAVVFRSTK